MNIAVMPFGYWYRHRANRSIAIYMAEHQKELARNYQHKHNQMIADLNHQAQMDMIQLQYDTMKLQIIVNKNSVD